MAAAIVVVMVAGVVAVAVGAVVVQVEQKQERGYPRHDTRGFLLLCRGDRPGGPGGPGGGGGGGWWWRW